MLQERVLFGPLFVTLQASSLYTFTPIDDFFPASVKKLPLLSLRNDLGTKLSFPLKSIYTGSGSYDSAELVLVRCLDKLKVKS